MVGIGGVEMIFSLLFGLLFLSIPVATLVFVILIFNKIKKIEKSLSADRQA